ncbi:PIN-like domain-containing protein [Micromonospora sp. NBC_01392]|uniref:PIN-like domain-containing protein n=1 Tax=Micromonospora sp. NBC_01392 TaxID=2903588 RepID=UPI00324552C8
MSGLFDGFEGFRVLADEDIDRALKSAVVAVDANVLLNLYRYNTRTAKDLLAVLESFEDRLVVPHQAVNEFHRNRLTAVGNPEGAAAEARSALVKNLKSTSDTLGRWAKQVALDDTELVRLRAAVDRLYDDLVGAIGGAEPDRIHAATPAAHDQILSRLTGMLEGRVIPRPSDEIWERWIREGQRRVDAQSPPGFLDADKGDRLPEGASGDYLVWVQACEAARQRRLDLVIVTGDEKDDWWWRHRNVVVGPRPELTQEFFEISDGRRLFLMRPRDLLQRSQTLNVEVSPDSLADADRAREELDPAAHWTVDTVRELLRRLDQEGQVQAEVIRVAAEAGGVIGRDEVYELCGYDDERMLRGFTRPTNRITADLQRAALLPDNVAPMLKPLYPDGVRASAFRVPSEVVEILASMADPLARSEDRTEAGTSP